jgi:hypothetical protein
VDLSKRLVIESAFARLQTSMSRIIAYRALDRLQDTWVPRLRITLTANWVKLNSTVITAMAIGTLQLESVAGSLRVPRSVENIGEPFLIRSTTGREQPSNGSRRGSRASR